MLGDFRSPGSRIRRGDLVLGAIADSALDPGDAGPDPLDLIDSVAV